MDLHIHDTHFIGLICGVPGRVFSTGVLEGDAVAYLTTQYLYGPGGPAISCSSGAVAQKGRPFVHGYEIYLERATLIFESGTALLTMLSADGKVEQPKLQGGGDPTSAFITEIQTAVDGIASGKEPDLLSGKLARRTRAVPQGDRVGADGNVCDGAVTNSPRPSGRRETERLFDLCALTFTLCSCTCV